MNLLMIVYLILLLIRPQDYPMFADSHWPYQQMVLGAAGLMWLVFERKSFDAPQYPLMLTFVVVLMASVVVNGWAGGALYVAVEFVPVGLAFLLMAHAANSPKRIRQFMGVFSLCAAVLAVHGIEQASTGVGWTGMGLSEETRIQYVGIFNDPNDLGLLFVMCLPMAFYLSGQGGWLGLRRLFWLAIAGLLLWGIYLTDSRGTILAVLALVGIYVWRRRGLVTAAVLGGGALVAMLALPSRLQTVDVNEESAFGRVDSWYEGMQMFISHPVLGVGAGNYTDYNNLAAHNSFVLVLAETGYVGFTVWLALVGYSAWMMFSVVRTSAQGYPVLVDEHDEPVDDDEETDAAWRVDSGIAFTLFLSICAFFAAAFFLSRSYAIHLYLLLALAMAHYGGMRSRHPWMRNFQVSDDLLLWPAVAAVGAIALFIVVKVLLGMT